VLIKPSFIRAWSPSENVKLLTELILKLSVAALGVVGILRPELRVRAMYSWASYVIVIRSLVCGVSMRLDRTEVPLNNGIFRFLVLMYSTSSVGTNKVITEAT
jgi:hypothetical protein